MCLVLGFMISLARVTHENRESRLSALGPDQSRRINEGAIDIDAYQRMSDEVTTLQKQKTEMENALADQSKGSKALNDGLQEAKSFAGLTEVEGPGIAITLRDNHKVNNDIPGQPGVMPDQIIHDTDVLQVVNECYAAGAEAVSVNNHRITAGSSFRCVGPTILVNDVKIASPVVIRAIGDSDTLFGGLNLPGGVLSQIRQTDPSMVEVSKVEKMTLPAFTGLTSHKFAQVPKDSK